MSETILYIKMAHSVASTTLILVSVILLGVHAVATDASQQQCSKNLVRYKLCMVCEAAIPALGMTFKNCCADSRATISCRFCMKNTRLCSNLVRMVQTRLQSLIFDAKDSQTSVTISDDPRYDAGGSDFDSLELSRKDNSVQRSVNLLPVSIVSNSLPRPGPFSIMLDLYIQRESFPVSQRSNQSKETDRGISPKIPGEAESAEPGTQSPSGDFNNKTDTNTANQLNIVSSLAAPLISNEILPTDDARESFVDAKIDSPSNLEASMRKRWGALGFSSWRKLSMYKQAKNSKNLKSRSTVTPVSSGRRRRSASVRDVLRNLRKTKTDKYDRAELEQTGAKWPKELSFDSDGSHVVVDGDDILNFLTNSNYKAHVIDRKENNNIERYKNLLVRANDFAYKSEGLKNKPEGRYRQEKGKNFPKRKDQQVPVYIPNLSMTLDKVRADEDITNEKDIIIVDMDEEDPDGYLVESGPERDDVFPGALDKLRQIFQKRESADHGVHTEHWQQGKRWGSLGAGKFRRWWMGQV